MHTGLRLIYPSFYSRLKPIPSISSSTEGPWFKLWSALCHQGDVYSASFAAVPHIIQILSANPKSACFEFFQLPTAIELARHQRNVHVPDSLRTAYCESIEKLPSLVSEVSDRTWDATFCQRVLAAAAVGKRQYAIAELLLDVDDNDIGEILSRYFSG